MFSSEEILSVIDSLSVSNYTFTMLSYIEYPSWIRPEVVSFLPVRWYAVMYIVAFAIAYLLFRYQVRHDGRLEMSKDDSENMFLLCIVLLLVGAHLFSVFFYSDASYYLTHPWLIFWPFENGRFVGLPGMSYHGGVVGAIIGGIIFARRKKYDFFLLADTACAGIPLGYAFGRIGNFINAELYGRVTASPIGMVFPYAEKFSTNYEWVRNICDKVGIEYALGEYVNLPRHPSQLYEALFEGVVLWLVLWFICRPMIRKYALKPGSMLSFYLFGYGFARFFIEYFRQPDSNIGYVIALGKESDNIAVFQSFFNISKGQVFCFLMMAAAVVLYLYVNRREKKHVNH